MTHDCIQEEVIGRIKEFIENFKGMKVILVSIIITILVQVGTFLFLWGCLVTTVNKHERDIDKILQKLDSIRVVVVPTILT
jgi:hypothetical protein